MSAKQESIGTTTLGLTKWAHAMFFAGTVVIGWLFVKVIETAWTALNLTFVWAPPPIMWAVIAVGGGGAAGLALYMWRHPKVNKLSLEIVMELSKVTWPTRKELYASTVVVIVISIIASIILWLFDFFWAMTTDLIYL
jgi:preprotein translocase subunit SecE